MYLHLFGKNLSGSRLICSEQTHYDFVVNKNTLFSVFCFMSCFSSCPLFCRCICHWHSMRAHTIECMCVENNRRISLALALSSIFVCNTCVIRVSLHIPTQLTAYSSAHEIDISLLFFSKRQTNVWIFADGVQIDFWWNQLRATWKTSLFHFTSRANFSNKNPFLFTLGFFFSLFQWTLDNFIWNTF